MKKIALIVAAGALFALPSIANAEDAAAGAAVGAGTGAATGFAVGGPVGAAVGAGVGGIVGAGAADNDHHHDRVIVQEQRPAVTDRTCVRDSFGNEKCTVIRR
jgi:hypothetical protein